jgi:hypothetical protein
VRRRGPRGDGRTPLADPEKYDHKTESAGRAGGAPNVRYYKYIRGFSFLAYGYRRA